MLPEFGLLCLIAALLTACLRCFLPNPRALAWQSLLIAASLLCLIVLRLQSDFSVVNVALHSNRDLPRLYKITGSWGNHEGSMLLWALVLSSFGAILERQNKCGDPLIISACRCQAVLAAGILAFILFTSNPFARQFPVPYDGEALNPLLQDIGLAIHPPLLYLGYVGFSIVFSLSIAAMRRGDVGRDYARLIHPWILTAWSFLTLGLGLGSWWAYRELGWGGYWFWDPVENAALMPWLAGTALLHANIVLKKRGVLGAWVLLLSIITFALSLLGTFLVRSGILTSVHSFAADPTRGLFLLIYCFAAIGYGLFLFAKPRPSITDEALHPISREGLIIINNLCLLTATATILLGTLYPMLATSLFGVSLSVGPPYFQMTAVPLLLIPLFFAGLAPLIAWRRGSLGRAWKLAMPAWLATGAVVFLLLYLQLPKFIWGLSGFALAAWLGAGSLRLAFLKRPGRIPVTLAHFGMSLVVCGITASSLYGSEKEALLAPGEQASLGDANFALEHIIPRDTANYRAEQAVLQLSEHDKPLATLAPEFRHYAIRGTTTSESTIHSTLFEDFYAVAGEPDASGERISLRFYRKPMIGWIWAGVMLMTLGGALGIKRAKNLR